MNILVLNSGSSSIKYRLFQMETEDKVLATGGIENIGTYQAEIHHQVPGKPIYQKNNLSLDYQSGLKRILQLLVDPQKGCINNTREINAVGHRIVHGGEVFTHPVLINRKRLQQIEKVSSLAPLHNPVNVAGVYAVYELLPDAKQVAVFDTAFHQTMPASAFRYAIPLEYYSRDHVRRYGFHGISHAYVSKQAAHFLDKPLSDLKMITCHMGNGVSLTAIHQGISLDTSMGMTPLEGVMMGTRSGSIDPAMIPYLMEHTGKSAEQIIFMLNHQSGLLGVSGVSHDLRTVIHAMEEGNVDAKLALEMYVYQIRKMIGAYTAVLNDLDVLVFTAGVGENSSRIRASICRGFDYLGLVLDPQRNQSKIQGEREISSKNSQVAVLVIPTDEEQMIAEATKALVEGL